MELIRQAGRVAAALLAPVSRRHAQRRLEAVERVPLGPHHSLHLVRMGARALLIGVSPAGCALIESAAWEDCRTPEAQP